MLRWMRLEPGSYRTSDGLHQVFRVQVGRHRYWYLVSFKRQGLGWSEDRAESFDRKRDAQKAATEVR
jgi:hypothetical protein